MVIWIARHGETKLNKERKMQGLFDEPLSAKGIEQAKAMRSRLGGIHFDAVYSSPLQRAVSTAMILGNCRKEDIFFDKRLLEVDFGKYEQCPFSELGFAMKLYWAFPEIFPAPDTVETVPQIVARSHAFLRELEKKDYENVLVTAHGGILRGLSGYLWDRKNGIVWRPRMTNCQIRVFESIDGKHRFLREYKEEKQRP